MPEPSNFPVPSTPQSEELIGWKAMADDLSANRYIGGLTGGRVALVGAGPGEPGAITLRALECLAAAQVVIYDYLVNPSLLRWATYPNVELISLGSHAGQSRVLSQAEVCQLLVDQAKQGKSVVRLKSGDPMIFARASEEIAALRTANIPFEIVPGVTAAVAAGSFTGIPLTDREHASAVALITGHPAADRESAPVTDEPQPTSANSDSNNPILSKPDLDWEALAKFPGTLVVYMGTTQVEYWVAELLRYGKDPATPVAIVRRCGFSDQSVVKTRLDCLVTSVTHPKRLRPPVVFLIGFVVDVDSVANWFLDRPLFGQGILITRPANQVQTMIRSLEQLGANVYCWPAIQIAPVTDTSELDREIRKLTQYEWVIFNSVNGVEHFFRRLWQLDFDARALRNCQLACIGSQTSQALAKYSLRCDATPVKFDADHLADCLEKHVAGQRCLIIRASRGRNELATRLQAAGAQVTEVVAYQNLDTPAADPEILAAFDTGKIGWVTATSSAIAENMVRCFGSTLRQAKIASISPITSRRLEELGMTPAAEATEYTANGLIAAICEATLASKAANADTNAEGPKRERENDR